MSNNINLMLGDCLERMRELPDNSVDSIVTDPPYGLSAGSTKGVSDRLGDIALDVVLPDIYDANSKIGRVPKFFGPFNSVSFLDFMLRAARVESGIAVPESSVDFESYVSRKKKVEDARESSVTIADGDLSLDNDALAMKFVGDYILQPRTGRNPTFGYGKSRLFTQYGSGRFAVPVVIPCNSRFASFLCTLAPSSPSFVADLVRLINNALSDSDRTPCVMACSGAELRAILAFDSGNGSLELLPANGASDDGVVFEVCTAQPIRASTGASGLPAKFEPRGFRFVGDETNRTLTFHFHRDLLAEMQYSRKGFMGKDWDSEVPSEAIWRECLRVLKPGGHLLAFAGTRTQHRMAVRIEDAGFEIRDMIAWVYSTGFPKSLDVSKAIDKTAGAEREVIGKRVYGDGHVQNSTKLAPPIGTFARTQDERIETAPATDAAQQWQGWGTALKPALEPITVARKPLIGTVAENVLAHGTGAINVDGCRVSTDDTLSGSGSAPLKHGGQNSRPFHENAVPLGVNQNDAGRWPANLIHDGSQMVLDLFPQTGPSSGKPRNNGAFKSVAKNAERPHTTFGHSDNGGSAARFFYCPKTAKKDRGEENNHPTVKPTDLMRYLCRLVTQPGGTVLDPFMGSGSTGKAAALEGFSFIGIERDEAYFEIAKARIKNDPAP